MFDIFERRNNTIADRINVPPIPAVKATAPECPFTVGTTSDGMMTVLKVGDVHTTTTLILNEVATRRLIRMLEATLKENEE